MLQPIRPKRILIFCGTRAAVERYDMAGIPILTGLYSAEVREKTLYHFNISDDGLLAVSPGMLHGFHVVPDTLVVFDSSWVHGHDDPRTIQAKARVSQK